MNTSERARLDYEWSMMNAVERTEALRSDFKFLRDQLVGLSGRVGDIEDRADLELMRKAKAESAERIPYDVVRERLGISTHYEGDDCPGGHITPAELARLRRIEEAVSAFIQGLDACTYSLSWLDEGPLVKNIRAALDSEPKR